MCLIWVNCMLMETLPERLPDARPAHQRSRQLKPQMIRAENAATAPLIPLIFLSDLHGKMGPLRS